MKKTITIGVLALQGAFREHKRMLEKMEIVVKEVRKANDLEGVSGLIMPGGESTAISLLWKEHDLYKTLKKRIQEKNLAVYGTCAGAILLAKTLSGKNPPKTLELMDMSIERNAYGSQLDSFIEPLSISDLKIESLPAFFIRAPKIEKVGKGVKILAKRKNGEIVLAQQENILVSTFHPELTDDNRIHQYFVEMCKGIEN